MLGACSTAPVGSAGFRCTSASSLSFVPDLIDEENNDADGNDCPIPARITRGGRDPSHRRAAFLARAIIKLEPFSAMQYRPTCR